MATLHDQKVINNLDANTGKLPAGTYFIGDLSTFVDPDTWMFVCENLWPFSTKVDTHSGILTDRTGKKLAVFRTPQGNGTYSDQDGNSYPISSGTIGAYPFDPDGDQNVDPSGIVHVMDKSFSCSFVKSSGVAKFGSIHINTNVVE
tara:strand:- start:66 stop:503 length:438 start_codon:yes stop_codon:yes gene_type:complete